jgi:hypothetical protein
MATVSPLACTHCGAPLPEGVPGQAVLTECPVCRAKHEVVLFPAFHRAPAPGAAPQAILAAGEAACFYHAEKRAVVPCDACGRFLCALCDVKLGEQHFCPACLQSGREASHLAPVERGRVRYDQIVWSLVVVPVPLCFLMSPLTATGALGLALWKWKAPPSLVVNTRARLVTGMLLAVLEIATVTWVWSSFFAGVKGVK